MSQLTTEDLQSDRRNGYLLYHKPLLADKGSKLSDELDRPHIRDERLLEFLLSDEVLDLVEPIVGPNIALWSSHFICKDPYTGRATPWHEDSAFWEGRLSTYDSIVTVWLALDRSTKDNGCMAVIPGTHDNGFSEYVDVARERNTFTRQIKDIDTSKAVYFELEPGECSLHDGRIIHGAAANTSPMRRCGYTMRYFPTSVEVYPEKNPDHRTWLARGDAIVRNSMYAVRNSMYANA
jgi:ectoine hydroxylase-related dioxygenase (phytanoyl-CoA dioxygenase family)